MPASSTRTKKLKSLQKLIEKSLPSAALGTAIKPEQDSPIFQICLDSLPSFD
jgi:hypothetical protein